MADVHEHARQALAKGMAVIIEELESEMGGILKVSAEFIVKAPVASYDKGWREWAGHFAFAWNDGDKKARVTGISEVIGKSVEAPK